jgi:AmmeMemoRadiSam system protein A
MAPSRSIDLSLASERQLLNAARESVHCAVDQRDFIIDEQSYSRELKQIAASFVTLTMAGQLRGCIGSLESEQPLIANVVDNARKASTRDPRFSPVGAAELPNLRYHISVLSALRPLSVSGEEELLGRLVSGVDGVMIQSGQRQATFLPSVWQQLPAPAEFMSRLKQKAGLGENEWPEDIQVFIYHCLSMSDP